MDINICGKTFECECLESRKLSIIIRKMVKGKLPDIPVKVRTEKNTIYVSLINQNDDDCYEIRDLLAGLSGTSLDPATDFRYNVYHWLTPASELLYAGNDSYDDSEFLEIPEPECRLVHLDNKYLLIS